VDTNRLEQVDRWGLFELLLTVIKESCHAFPQNAGLFQELSHLHKEVITTRDALLAYRYFEMAVKMLVVESNIDLFLLFTEFDGLYRDLTDLDLSNLRAIRDTYKYRVNYGLCLHDLPDRIRKESSDRLTDLASRNITTLRPYSRADAETMIRQLETRKSKEFPPDVHRSIFELSGGHPGLLGAVFDSLEAEKLPSPEVLTVERLLGSETVLRACRSLWKGLAEDEQNGLENAAHGWPMNAQIRDLLQDKHLVQRVGGRDRIFSPLFTGFINQCLVAEPDRLIMMPETFQVRIGSAPPIDLSQREYRLIATLYAHLREVVTKDEIRDDVYDGEDVSDEAIASLVRQARNKIEPVKGLHRYIRNAFGKGYILFDLPEEDNVPSDDETDA
jgi:DNA-binding winged helix-turn-helix (wHTH) protein